MRHIQGLSRIKSLYFLNRSTKTSQMTIQSTSWTHSSTQWICNTSASSRQCQREPVGHPTILPMLEDVCRRQIIYLVVDGVNVGMGRTGEMFSFQHHGVSPDVVILGKSLGGGPRSSAVVAGREILDAGHSQALFTDAGNALSCAARLATIEAI